MDIIKDVFKRSKINIDKLLKYGFIKENNTYKIIKNIDNDFRFELSINKDNITSVVYDNNTNEIYDNINIDSIDGAFINSLREKYKNILIDIKDNCFDRKYFIYEQSNRIASYIINKYNDYPEFLWDDTPTFGVFRKKKNNKWYGLIGNINKNKIDNENKDIEVMNLKIDEDKINELVCKNGYYRAYHMNKRLWITIVLDDTLKDEEIYNLIDESYNNVR